ncbi:DUF3299 domain-containing protein [Chitinophaga japonensis]|uniref:DUF3299 domain-containing protein n=1 Tax=Chitinophaga japonensis TaxID=104662 RepID=A0A562TE30_CHIJA|nr:DUF3299 domain-containing protein [Chitinophaga japonensis]TWI91514.1 hypothetical protein LX66_0883 [Chitinophaga japonensis]
MRNTTQRYLLLAAALLLVACTDLSRYCRHAGSSYLQRFLLLREAALSAPAYRYAASPLPWHTTTAPPPDPAPEQDKDPRPVSWRQLKDVVFNRIWDDKLDMPMLYPQFSRGIKSLNGAYIRISGYVIPLDVKGGIYVLSANPNNACFFCGGAGPESVMALQLKPGHPRFKTDDYLTFTGRLRLNEKNIYELYYNLDGAEATQ